MLAAGKWRRRKCVCAKKKKGEEETERKTQNMIIRNMSSKNENDC